MLGALHRATSLQLKERNRALKRTQAFEFLNTLATTHVGLVNFAHWKEDRSPLKEAIRKKNLNECSPRYVIATVQGQRKPGNQKTENYYSIKLSIWTRFVLFRSPRSHPCHHNLPTCGGIPFEEIA